MPRLSFVGVHGFAHGLAQPHAFGPVVAPLTQAALAQKAAHPDEDFALLHHRESTIVHRFEALFFAPLLGLNRLSEWGIREHPLQTLSGHGDQSATLRQFLGPLERVDAAESLMPVLVAHEAGPIISVDGHLIASWSRRSMHKGKITMLGRILAGSQAVMAHDDPGQAVFVASSPPDIHVSQIMVVYCQQVAEGIGSVVLVIDRAGNAVALAQEFAEKDLGWLCLLDDNEPTGLGSFETTLVETLEDGTRV